MLAPPVYDMRAVFVTDIPLTVDYHSLRYKFARFGNVQRLYFHSSTSTRAFAFVHFQSRSSVDKIMRNPRGIILHGQVLSVSLKKIDGLSYQEISQSPDVLPPSYHVNPEQPSQEEPHNENLLSRLLSIKPVEDSLASKFQPCLETVIEDASGEDTYDPSALYYDTNGELIIGESSGTSNGLVKNESKEDYSNPGRGLTRVIRVDNIPMTWDAGVLFSNLMQSGVNVPAVLVYDDIDDRGLRQGLIQLPNTASDSNLSGKLVLSSANLTLTVAPSSVLSIGPVRKGYSGKFSAFCVSDLSKLQNRSDVEVKESLTYPDSITDLNLNEVNFPNHDLESIPEETSSMSEGTNDASKIFLIGEQSQSLPRKLKESHGRGDGSAVRAEPAAQPLLASTYDEEPHRKVDFFQLGASPDSMSFNQRDSELWSPLSPYSPTSPPIFPITGKQVCPNKPASKTSEVMSVKQMTKSYLNSPEEDLSKGKTCLGPAPNKQKDRLPQDEADVEKKQLTSRNNSTGCHEIALTKEFIPISLAYTPKASQTLVVDNFWTNGLNDPAAFANSLAVFGDIVVADIVKLTAEYSRIYVTFGSHISAELALCRLSCRAVALQLRLA